MSWSGQDYRDRLVLTPEQLDRYYAHICLPHVHRHPQGETSRRVAQGPGALAFLKCLMVRNLALVPFENLFLHYSADHTIHTDAASLYEKIVGPLDAESMPAQDSIKRSVNRRGGYCMSNSMLFNTILRSIGFTVFSTGGRVSTAMQPGPTPKRGHHYSGWNHMVNLVDIEGQRYLVDVGMGSTGPCHPIPLLDSTAGYFGTNVHPQTLRLQRRAIPDCTDARQRLWCYDVRHREDQEWLPAYCFTETEFLPEDFRAMNHFTSTSRTSFFTWAVICVKFLIAAPGHPLAPNAITQTGQEALVNDVTDLEIVGDLTLNGDHVSSRVHGETHVVAKFATETERVEALEKWFGIRLNHAQKAGIAGTVVELG